MILLTSTNYFTWRGRMKDLLYVKDYDGSVFLEEKPEGMTDEKWANLHQKTCSTIRQWIDDSIVNHVSEDANARVLWRKLEELFRAKTGNNKLYYIKKMMGLKYQEGTAVADHINDFLGTMKELSGLA